MEHVFAQLGITMVAAIAAAWAAVKFLGKAWIDHRLELATKKIEDRQERALERLKSDLELLRGQFAKFHDQEFIVLPEVWRKMSSAIGELLAATDAERVMPSALGMNEGELNEYLERAPLLVWEKGRIRSFPPDQGVERDKELHNMLDWAAWRKASELAEDFTSFLQAQRIFLSTKLARQLDETSGTLNGAIKEYRRFLEARQEGKPAVDLIICAKLKNEARTIAATVQQEIRDKLVVNL
jgi:hypothetical protein